jgi:hypothetical protein
VRGGCGEQRAGTEEESGLVVFKQCRVAATEVAEAPASQKTALAQALVLHKAAEATMASQSQGLCQPHPLEIDAALPLYRGRRGRDALCSMPTHAQGVCELRHLAEKVLPAEDARASGSKRVLLHGTNISPGFRPQSRRIGSRLRPGISGVVL